MNNSLCHSNFLLIDLLLIFWSLSMVHLLNSFYSFPVLFGSLSITTSRALTYYMYLPLYYHVDVFILQARRPKYELFSLHRVFC